MSEFMSIDLSALGTRCGGEEAFLDGPAAPLTLRLLPLCSGSSPLSLLERRRRKGEKR